VRDPLEQRARPTGEPDETEPSEKGQEAQPARVRAVIGLGLLVLLAVLTVAYPWTMAIVAGVVALIMAHEAGHLIAAKRSGMLATEFFVGFGPRIWSFQRGETEYGVKAIPAGGYVRIVGMNNLEEVDPADEPRTYRQGRSRDRLVVVLAGVTINVLIAVALLFGVYATRGVPGGLSTTLSEVLAGSPAAEAGIEAGDRILSIGGAQIDEWDDVSESLEERAGETIAVVIERDGVQREVRVAPRPRTAGSDDGFLGIGPSEAIDDLSVLEAGGETVRTIRDGTTGFVDALANFFSPAGISDQSERVTGGSGGGGSGGGGGGDGPVGIIGIVDVGGDIVDGDLWRLLELLAAINLVIGLFNLVPLLPFDGGHAAIVVYEAVASRVRGRRVQANIQKLMPITAVVVTVLLMFAVSVAIVDLRRAIGS